MEKDFLKGKRIAITALELENKEHRGIASFIKSSIKVLSKYGAEIYLITGFDLDRKFKKNSDKESENSFISEVYNFLSEGRDHRELFNSSKKYKLALILELIKNLFKLSLNNYFLKYKIYKINEDFKYKKTLESRIKYLVDVKGFISIKNIFHLCRLRSMRFLIKDPILNLKKENIDLIISTSPISLKQQNNESSKLIQIIHDALPLQIPSHPENGWIFYNRLNDAHKHSNCLYVSQESKNIVTNFLNIKNPNSNANEIIYPMPSLEIELLEQAFKIPFIRSINTSFILFNSSIVSRKKVENAINILSNYKNLISPSGSAECKIQSYSANVINEGKHSEFISSYKFNCENISKLKIIYIKYFKSFENGKKLNIKVVGEKKKSVYVIEKSKKLINVKNHF